MGEELDLTFSVKNLEAAWGGCTFGKNNEVNSPKDLLRQMGVKKVIFNKGTTIVYLTTGEKGVAKRSIEDKFDPAIGFSMAYAIAESKASKKKYKELVDRMYIKRTFEV